MVSLLCGVIAFLACHIFQRQIISIFGSGSSEAYYEFAVRYFRIYLFMAFINFLPQLSPLFMTAIGKPARSTFLPLTRQIIFFLPLLVVFPMLMDIDGIITASGDCIHTAAGEKTVAEIPGSFKVNICTGCGKWIYDYEILNHGEMPTSPECGSVLEPFSSCSHIGVYEPALKEAQEWMSQAGLILIIGATGCCTSTCLDYKKPGAKIIRINPGRTCFNSEASLNIREEADPVFEELIAKFYNSIARICYFSVFLFLL